MASSNTYLIRNQYSNCFRLKVPIDLQKFVGRKEIRYNLNTGSKTEAGQKARLLVGHIRRLFRQLRGDYSDEFDSATVSPPETIEEPSGIRLSQLVDDYFNENLRAGKWSPRTIKEYKNMKSFETGSQTVN